MSNWDIYNNYIHMNANEVNEGIVTSWGFKAPITLLFTKTYAKTKATTEYLLGRLLRNGTSVIRDDKQLEGVDGSVKQMVVITPYLVRQDAEIHNNIMCMYPNSSTAVKALNERECLKLFPLLQPILVATMSVDAVHDGILDYQKENPNKVVVGICITELNSAEFATNEILEEIAEYTNDCGIPYFIGYNSDVVKVQDIDITPDYIQAYKVSTIESRDERLNPKQPKTFITSKVTVYSKTKRTRSFVYENYGTALFEKTLTKVEGLPVLSFPEVEKDKTPLTEALSILKFMHTEMPHDPIWNFRF